jgi:hypothetical protein
MIGQRKFRIEEITRMLGPGASGHAVIYELEQFTVTRTEIQDLHYGHSYNGYDSTGFAGRLRVRCCQERGGW